jgi:hypothetical protein
VIAGSDRPRGHDAFAWLVLIKTTRTRHRAVVDLLLGRGQVIAALGLEEL